MRTEGSRLVCGKCGAWYIPGYTGVQAAGGGR